MLAVALLYRIVAPRFGTVAALVERARARGVPVVRRGLARQRRRSAADPADARRLRRRPRGDRVAAACGRLVGVRRARRARVQHEGARGARSASRGSRSAYLVCAPGSVAAAARAAAAAGVVSVARLRVVERSSSTLTPASQRPFVGSTSTNSEISADLRLQRLRPRRRPGGRPGLDHADPPRRRAARRWCARAVDAPRDAGRAALLRAHPPPPRRAPPAPPPSRPRRGRTAAPHGQSSRSRSTLAPRCGSSARGLGDQAGWVVPLALLGCIALLLVVRRRGATAARPALFVLGGWFLRRAADARLLERASCTPITPRRSGPGLAAMVGAGARRARLAACAAHEPRTALTGYVLSVIAVGGTVAAQLFLIERYGRPALVADPARRDLRSARCSRSRCCARARRLGARRRGRRRARRADGLQLQRLAGAGRTAPSRRPGPTTTPATGGFGVKRASRCAPIGSLIHFLRTHGATAALRAADASPPTRRRR